MARSGDTVVDIGANNGEFTLCAAAAVGHPGRVICYEPNPSCVDCIRSLIKLNNLTNISVRPVGLSDHQAILTLKIPAINDGEATFGSTPYSDVQTVNVETKVGDEDLVGIDPVFIKIDVEGFEVYVINGLSKTLARCRPVVMTEVFDPHLRRCGSSRQHLDSAMDELGYECYEVDKGALFSTRKLRLRTPRTDGALFDAVWLPRDRLDDFASYTG